MSDGLKSRDLFRFLEGEGETERFDLGVRLDDRDTGVRLEEFDFLERDVQDLGDFEGFESFESFDGFEGLDKVEELLTVFSLGRRERRGSRLGLGLEGNCGDFDRSLEAFDSLLRLRELFWLWVGDTSGKFGESLKRDSFGRLE